MMRCSISAGFAPCQGAVTVMVEEAKPFGKSSTGNLQAAMAAAPSKAMVNIETAMGRRFSRKKNFLSAG
jgi:hypothetical protein